MNVAIVSTSTGTAVATILPSAVSPIVRWTSATTPPAMALATRKINTAASTFGREAQIAPPNPVNAATPSTDAASEIAPRRTAQNTIRPTSHEGAGSIRCRKFPPVPVCRARSRPARCVARHASFPSRRAMIQPINRTAMKPSTCGSQPKNTESAWAMLTLRLKTTIRSRPFPPAADAAVIRKNMDKNESCPPFVQDQTSRCGGPGTGPGGLPSAGIAATLKRDSAVPIGDLGRPFSKGVVHLAVHQSSCVRGRPRRRLHIGGVRRRLHVRVFPRSRGEGRSPLLTHDRVEAGYRLPAVRLPPRSRKRNAARTLAELVERRHQRHADEGRDVHVLRLAGRPVRRRGPGEFAVSHHD